MRIPNRFMQYALKSLLTTVFLYLSTSALAQNPPATEAASASSAASSAAPEKPIYADNVERDNDLLVKALTEIAKTDELQWLETPNEKVLSLYKMGETRKTKGVLLILHAPETPQLWPVPLENLRRNLPLYSWATMTLPLPAKYEVAIPARESSSAASTSTEATSAAASSAPAQNATTAESSAAASSEPAKPIIARDQLITERVDAAIAQLNKIGQFNLVIMVDNSSAPAALASLYKKINKATTNSDTIDGPLQALILVNLQDQEPLSREQLSAIFSVSDLPIMDVFFNPDNKVQSELRRLHQAEAMRQNIKDYQQFILPLQPPVTIDETQNFWLGKIHGFLATKAEGSEVSGKRGNSVSTPINMK
jgi:hypothetical protein